MTERRTSMGSWVDLPAVGAVVYFERGTAETPELVRALIAELFAVEGIAERELKMVARIGAKWRGFSWRAVDTALAEPTCTSIALLVGTASEVHLGAEIRLRGGDFEPATAWFVAETERWSASHLAHAGRCWLARSAELGTPLSGGVLAASALRYARMEASLTYETGAGEQFAPETTLFRQRLHQDRSREAWGRIRRLYPVTLLGPSFASSGNAELLRGAGARCVEPVSTSLLVDADAPLASAWSPEFLAATLGLRRLLWPLTFRNPADAEGLGLGPRFEPREQREASPTVPDPEKHYKQVRALLARERKKLEDLLAHSVRPPITGELVRPVPEREPPPIAALPAPRSRRRKPTNLGDLF